MREKIQKITRSLFSLIIILAIAGGGVVFIMFILGIIIGGSTGNSLALSARNTVMPLFIRSAAIGVLMGLINYYASGNHALTMDDND